jgi:glycosyltransferase 2 family protein
MKVRALQITVGLGCALFFLALVFHRVPLAAVGSTLAGVDPMCIGAAMAVYAVNLALRARRWKIILRPVAAIPYSTVARALVVGYGLNTIMPARLGELARAEYVKMDHGLSRLWTLTSIVVERLFDGLAVVACLGVGLLLAAATRQSAGVLIDVVLTGGVLFGMILLAALCLAGPTASSSSPVRPDCPRR